MKPPARTLLPVLGMILAVGCGIKNPPLPPIIRVAERTRDLAVEQRDREATLVWSYPSSTTAGEPLIELDTIEVWRATLKEVEAPPPAADVRERDLNQQLLLSGGERIAVLDQKALHAATRGSTLEYRDDLEAWRDAHPAEDPQVLWYAVRTVCCGGRESALSNIARLIPTPPPDPPTGLGAEPEPDGIRLRWTATEDRPVLVERSADGSTWRTVSADPVSGTEWIDRTAGQGRTWSYRLRSVLRRDGQPRVVGGAGDILTLTYADRYPPAAPAGLVCLPEGERVRLRWQEDPDAATYRVVRRSGSAEEQTLAEAVDGVGFDDTAPPPGASIYRVTAIDAAGNASEPATCTAARGAGP
jgi:hypothetical protein